MLEDRLSRNRAEGKKSLNGSRQIQSLSTSFTIVRKHHWKKCRKAATKIIGKTSGNRAAIEVFLCLLLPNL